MSRTPIEELLSPFSHSPIYCLVNGEYIMFYSVFQAWLYMRAESNSLRKEILKDINIEPLLKLANSGKFKWRRSFMAFEDCGKPMYHTNILFELYRGLCTQNTEIGLALCKVKSTKICKLDIKVGFEIDQGVLYRILTVVRKRLKKTKTRRKTFPYFSPNLEDRGN